MRAAVYVRLSRDTDASTSVERQEQACREYIQREGWELAGVYRDVDVSAYRGRDRPGLSQLRQEYRSLDAVVFYRLDRLARSVVHYRQLLEDARSAGVRLVSVTEALDTGSPTGLVLATIVAALAEMESATIGQRVSAAQDHMARQGLHRGGRLPFGWTVDEDGAVVLDEVEAPLLLELVDRFMAGTPITALASEYNRRAVPLKYGAKDGTGPGRWDQGVIRRQMLRNPRLIGRLRWRGSIVRADELACEPLLSEERWVAMQQRLDAQERRERPYRLSGADLLLSGFATCGRCGAPLFSNAGRYRNAAGDQLTRWRYRCGAPAGLCRGVYVSATRLDDHVAALLLARYGRTPVQILAELDAAHDPAPEERAAITAALAELEADHYLRGGFSGAGGGDRFRALQAELEQQLAALPAPAPRQQSSDEGSLADWWPSADNDARQAVVHSAVHAVTVHPSQGSSRRWNPSRVTVLWEP